MPKQIKDINKSSRMKYAMDAIEHYGKCSHKEICQFVSNKIHIDPDLQSFKKSIHNDIKDLIKDYLIGVKYFTPGGDSISLGEEDKFRNKRTEYFVLGGEGQIKGNKLLKKFDADFRPQRLSSPKWEINKITKSSFSKNKIGLLLRFRNYYYVIEADRDELPFKIAIARTTDYVPTQEDIENNFGKRSSLLLLPWKFLSSSRSDKLCHFIVQVSSNDKNEICAQLTFVKGEAQDHDDFYNKISNIGFNSVDVEKIKTALDESLHQPSTYLVTEQKVKLPFTPIQLTSATNTQDNYSAEFPERVPANFLNGYHLISSKGTT